MKSRVPSSVNCFVGLGAACVASDMTSALANRLTIDRLDAARDSSAPDRLCFRASLTTLLHSSGSKPTSPPPPPRELGPLWAFGETKEEAG